MTRSLPNTVVFGMSYIRSNKNLNFFIGIYYKHSNELSIVLKIIKINIINKSLENFIYLDYFDNYRRLFKVALFVCK